MNLLTLTTDIEIYRSYSRKPIEIPAGEYLVHPKLANYIAETYPFHAETRGWPVINNKVKDTDVGKTVLLICPAGIGDTIFALPTANYIRNVMGNKVTLAVAESMIPLIPSIYYDDIVAVEKLPFDFAMRHGRIIPFMWTLDPEHRSDQFHGAAELAGLPESVPLVKPQLDDPQYDLSKNWQREISFFGFKNAVLQYSASSPVKSLPEIKLWGITEALIADGYHVWVSDVRANEGKIEFLHHHCVESNRVTNFARMSQDISDFAFLVSRAGLVITPDSAAVHLAGCYNTPCVGIFSPFPPRESTGLIYDSVKPVFVRDGCKYRNAETGGCYTYGLDPCKAAQEQGKEYSPCWDNLNVQDVVDAYRSITLDKK